MLTSKIIIGKFKYEPTSVQLNIVLSTGIANSSENNCHRNDMNGLLFKMFYIHFRQTKAFKGKTKNLYF